MWACTSCTAPFRLYPDVLFSCMCGCRGTRTCPAHSAVSESQALVTRKRPLPRLGHPLYANCALASEQKPDRQRATSEAALDDLGAVGGSRRSRLCGSQNWEPTCSAALGRSSTHSDSSSRSGAPRSTQFDGSRHSK